jgi:hypothetical protein
MLRSNSERLISAGRKDFLKSGCSKNEGKKAARLVLPFFIKYFLFCQHCRKNLQAGSLTFAIVYYIGLSYVLLQNQTIAK